MHLVRLSGFLLALLLVPPLALAATVQVSVLDNSYSPQTVNIQQGDTVVWTNYGSLGHSVIADNNAFTSSTIAPGVNFSYTFNTAGPFAYHDVSYGSTGGSGMSGTVNVSGVNSVAPPSGSTSALQAQAQALLAQISQLQQQLGGGTAAAVGSTVINSSSCPNIGRTLKLGSSGSDVSRLQQFLAQSPGIYPEGTVSGYYGSLTQAAVSRWQAKYNIVSSGSPATTGWGVVGPRTAAAIALLCSTGSTSGATTNTNASAPAVGGLIQVTPVSGPAPLTVNIQTTVNTTDSCIGALYVLNYGDGTQPATIPTASGSCLPALQAFSHTYNTAGTYQVSLSSGTHQTTATITVTGAASSSGTSIPADSLQASIRSGVAPLAVVFTGTVSNPVALGCTGTCTDTINFGDGAVGLVQIPATPGGWQSYVINHTFTAAGSYTVQFQSVTGAPEGAPITINVSNVGAATTTTATGGSFAIVSVTSNVGGNAFAVTANITLPACAAYQVNWGDSTSATTGTAPCTSGGAGASMSHTYASKGNYTIALNNGSGAVQANASVSISN